ncbi:HNH endonuclease family protein [Burkholderia pseudomallei]|nr:HNH endonuclease family protein [Burkholderia pseudomallei]CAK0159421.1 HNH endonuclease family protein [Burkholderia pseudomallei]
MDSEIWKPVVGCEGLYEVSNRGRIRSLDRYVRGKPGCRPPLMRGRILKQNTTPKGYRFVLLVVDGKQKMTAIHVAVAAAFIGPRPLGHEVAHGDGDKSNNCLGNLRYATPRDNQADRRVHGTTCEGEKHPMAKLSEEEVRAIRRSATGTKALAAQFGVHPSAIVKIRARVTWKHVADA